MDGKRGIKTPAAVPAGKTFIFHDTGVIISKNGGK
jgi:hypothetical protein